MFSSDKLLETSWARGATLWEALPRALRGISDSDESRGPFGCISGGPFVDPSRVAVSVLEEGVSWRFGVEAEDLVSAGVKSV